MSSDAFYLGLQAEAAEVIAEFGTTYNVKGAGTFDPLLGEEVVEGEDRLVVGLVSDQADSFMPAGSSQATWYGRKSLIMTAAADIRKGDLVTVDGKTYPLDSAVSIKPANVVVIYILELKG
ncbi:head-closure protein [Vibrio phage 2.117.O._10N.261.45.E9]|nr:head-closure protein [Vibrio phage 1.117.O._10N.261.45.E9]AUR95435.1 head-closure protein [Vibrio phage 1.207.B._10N.222.51.C2]AUS02326.1 head-closure protein [Vibrio phage 2.117.O._10N.261.45.E9]